MKHKDIELIAAGCAREAKIAQKRAREDRREMTEIKVRGAANAASPAGLLAIFPALKAKAPK